MSDEQQFSTSRSTRTSMIAVLAFFIPLLVATITFAAHGRLGGAITFGFVTLMLSSALAVFRISLRPVVLRRDVLIVPTTHRRSAILSVGSIHGIGLTHQGLTKALTVWTTDGEVCRSTAVCSIDGPEGRKATGLVIELWNSVSGLQGPRGPLVTTQKIPMGSMGSDGDGEFSGG